MDKRKRNLAKYPADAVCKVEDCNCRPRIDWLCAKHYARVKRWNDVDMVHTPQKKNRKCTVIDKGLKCENKHQAKGMCQMHYRRNDLWGDPTISKKRIATKPRKYRVLKRPELEGTRKDGTIFEHRFVMQVAIGRPLLAHENVHHKNGDGMDNRLQNLELWSTWQPYGQRVSDKVEWAVELLKQYAPERLRSE